MMDTLSEKLNVTGRVRCFDGWQLRIQHESSALNCPMDYSVYLPPAADKGPVPAVYWLSGLTCTDENFVQKAGAQRYAAELGVALVAPDTSPRGEQVPDDPEAAWDFGLGAGFYVNATAAPWSSHYRMYDYVVEELPGLIASHFPMISSRRAIMGHSMGGHGALMIALRNAQHYSSVSAFAPIVAPTQCPWGHKALGNYLGNDRDEWKNWDSVELIARATESLPMKVSQGADDSFLSEQLKPELLIAACEQASYPLDYELCSGYDHSYFFIASFIQAHLRFHAQHLSA